MCTLNLSSTPQHFPPLLLIPPPLSMAGLPVLASGFSMGLSNNRFHVPSLIPAGVSKCFGVGLGASLTSKGGPRRTMCQEATAMLASDVYESSKGFQMPHPDIRSLVEAEQTPTMLISPPATGSEWIAVMQKVPLLSLDDLAQPELKLAGARFLPELDIPSRKIRSHSLVLKQRTTGEEFQVSGIPADGKISSVNWSPDGTLLAFCVLTEPDGMRLYTLDPSKRVAKLQSDERLSSVLTSPYEWGSSGDQIIINAVPSARPRDPPAHPRVPTSPAIQECVTGLAAPARTYQDLLQDDHDEVLFEFFATTQLFHLSLKGQPNAIPQVGGGTLRQIGPPGMHTNFSPSPDGRFLLVERLRAPFSRTVQWNRFASDVEIRPLDRIVADNCGIVHRLPLAEIVPIGRDSCRWVRHASFPISASPPQDEHPSHSVLKPSAPPPGMPRGAISGVLTRLPRSPGSRRSTGATRRRKLCTGTPSTSWTS